jgi:hypothetical protein
VQGQARNVAKDYDKIKPRKRAGQESFGGYQNGSFFPVEML